MEADDMRAVFLEEFDAMGAYVSPVEDLSPVAVPANPVPAAEPGSTEAA
jgi:lysophospholipase